MRNYKNKNRIVNKKLIIAGIIIATQAIIFSGGKKLDKNFNVNVASAEVLKDRNDLVCDFNIESNNANNRLDGPKLYFEAYKYSDLQNKVYQTAEYYNEKIREVEGCFNRCLATFEQYSQGLLQAPGTAVVIAQRNLNNYVGDNDVQRQNLQTAYDNALGVYRTAEATLQGAKDDLNETKRVTKDIIDTLRSWRDESLTAELSGRAEEHIAVEIYDRIIDKADEVTNANGGNPDWINGIVFQQSALYKENEFLGIIPLVLTERNLVEYFDIYFKGINAVKWGKGVGRRDKIRFAQLIAGLISRILIYNRDLLHGYNLDTLIGAAAKAAYGAGITNRVEEFDKDAVKEIINAQADYEFIAFSDTEVNKYNLSLLENSVKPYPFVFTANSKTLSEIIGKINGDTSKEDKVKKTKEFAKLYSEYKKGFVKFRAKDLQEYWKKIDEVFNGAEAVNITGFAGNRESGEYADVGGAGAAKFAKAQKAKNVLFQFMHTGLKKVLNAGVKCTNRIFQTIEKGKNMDYAKEFYSRYFNEEGIEIDYSFDTLDEFIEFVNSLEGKYGAMAKRILKMFGKNKDYDDDDDDDDDYGKWWYKRDYLVYDNDGKNPKNCAPLFKEIKKFYKGLKKALEDYKAEVAAKNLSDSEKRKKAKSLKGKNAGKLANLIKEILTVTDKEADYYKNYISKIGNAEAEKSIKEAIQVILEEVVKNNDIHDIKDVYKLVNWGEYGETGIGGRTKIRAAVKQIRNAIKFANENSKEKADDKVKEINERVIREIIFNEALQLFLVKNCVKDFYSIGLFELINEERYDYEKSKRGITEEGLRIKIDKTKTPAENLRLILDEFLEKSAEPKTVGGIYLDLKGENEVISKIKDLMGKVYGKLEEAVSEDKEDEEEADDEETEAETDAETEDEDEKKAGEEEADMPIPPKEKEEIINAIKNSAFFETALYGQNNVALNCGRMKYSVGPDGHPHIELTGIPGVGEREVVCIAILNEKDVVTPYYYMNKVGGDKLSATIPLDVAQNAIAFHFYIQDPAQPDLFKGPFVGAMNGINPSVLRSRIDNATFKKAKAFVKPGEKKGIETKMWTIDMGNLLAVYVKGGNIEDLSTKVAIMCGQNALPPDFGTRNRYIFQKMSNGDFIVVIGGELRELVRNKFSVHIYNDNGEPGNFQYYIQAVSDANSEKPGENEKAENKENKENESKDDKLLKQIEDEEDTDDKAQEDKTDEKPKAKAKKKMKGKKYKDEDDNEEGKDKNDKKGKKKKGEKKKKDKKAKDDKEKDDNGLHLLQNLNDKKPDDDVFGDFGL